MISVVHAVKRVATATRILFSTLVVSTVFALPPDHVRAENVGIQLSVDVQSMNPLSGDEESIQAGLELYIRWCVQCHGQKADGVSRFGNFAAADLTKYRRGYPEFIVIVSIGRPKKQMPPWKGVLNDIEISQIGAYLETLADEGANWGMGE